MQCTSQNMTCPQSKVNPSVVEKLFVRIYLCNTTLRKLLPDLLEFIASEIVDMTETNYSGSVITEEEVYVSPSLTRMNISSFLNSATIHKTRI